MLGGLVELLGLTLAVRSLEGLGTAEVESCLALESCKFVLVMVTTHFVFYVLFCFYK